MLNLNNEKMLSTGLLCIRLILGFVFFYHGAQKLFGIFCGHGIQGTAGFFESKGIPFPVLSVYLAGGAQFLGGIALMLGFAVRPIGLILTFTMLVAAYTHMPNGFSNQKGGFEFPFTLAMISLSLFFTGGGKFSLASFIKCKKCETGVNAANQQA